LATIGAGVASGQDVSVDFVELSKSDDVDFGFNGIFMGMVGAFKGKWSFTADAMYMDVSADTTGTLTGTRGSRIPLSENVKIDVGLSSWVVTPTVGYDLYTGDKATLTLLGGLRYLWIKTSLEFEGSSLLKTRYHKISESQDNWDGIVGLRGQVLLSDKWYLPYYADIGAGDSDLTWQVFGGVGYRFKHCDLVGGYRYMAWDFGGDYLIEDLDMSGPLVGVKFMF
jgi:hypothetical protein